MKLEILDTNKWKETPYNLNKGSRVKAWYINNETGDLYLFKKSKETPGGKIFYAKFWSELIAYQLSLQLNIVEVPYTMLAYDPSEKIYGALIKNFLKEYNDETNKRKREFLLEGESFLEAKFSKTKDSKIGSYFTLSNLQDLLSQHSIEPDAYFKFLDILLFDALISNTDRHWDNWGIIKGSESTFLAPAYDNGTSLGRELDNNQILEILQDKNRFKSYVNKGKTVIYYDKDEYKSSPKQLTHLKLADRIIKNNFNKLKNWQNNLINFSDDKIDQLIQNFVYKTVYNELYNFTEERADFITQILKTRRDKLIEIFKNYE